MLKRVGKVVFTWFKRRPAENVWSLGGRGERFTAQRGVANVVQSSNGGQSFVCYESGHHIQPVKGGGRMMNVKHTTQACSKPDSQTP